nr:ferredoxin [Pyrobaculum arsenaticum]
MCPPQCVIEVRVDRWLCTGCGLCQGLVFTLEKGYSAVRPEFRTDEDGTEGLVDLKYLDNVKRAARACPNGGISWRLKS